MVVHSHLLVTGDHPSPHRDRVLLAALFFGVVAGPLAWAVQLVVNYALASHACFPHDRPLVGGGAIGGIWAAALIINLVAVAVALSAVAVSVQSWRKSRNEREGPAATLLEAGEGRTRFMAVWGELTALGFLIAILFDTTALFLVPQCVT